MSVIQQIKPMLQMTASMWIPKMFPNGTVTKDYLRVGDLTGAKGNSLAISLIGDKAGSWYDHATDQSGDCLDLICEAEGVNINEALEKAAEICGGDVNQIKNDYEQAKIQKHYADLNKLNYAKELLKKSKPIKGTIVEKYLRNREIAGIPEKGLRFLPSHIHQPTGKAFPVMLGVVRNEIGKIIAVHRTYLMPDGSDKANVEPNKMMLGSVKGGAIRLGDIEYDDDGLDGIIGIAEGVETALSASALNGGIPVWAVLSSGGMINFNTPKDETLAGILIFRDNDEAGENASIKLSNRLETENIRNTIVKPKDGLNDFNDELRGQNDKG